MADRDYARIIAALRAKADSTTAESEAASLRAKADELETKYGPFENLADKAVREMYDRLFSGIRVTWTTTKTRDDWLDDIVDSHYLYDDE